MPQPIAVLVVDGEDALRHHLHLLLATGRDIRLVAKMTNARQLLQVCLERQPDVRHIACIWHRSHPHCAR